MDEILSVAALNKKVNDLISANFDDLHVRGEISGLKRAVSGHLYFTLKDAQAAVSCVMFRFNAESLARVNPAFKNLLPRLKDGMQVILTGAAAVYERDGRYQLYVRSIREDGMGSLLEQKEQLRLHYLQLGYFEPELKKPLPYLPGAIGVVTSSTGAVIHDIENVVSRRFPGMLSRIILKDVRVQGEGAAEDIAAAIRAFSSERSCDVLIVGRGGGSIEDLWCFNEAVVVEAMHECPIPIISAIGHETDWTIADFVSDMRAPTPSAAAELAVPEYSAELLRIAALKERLDRSLKAGIDARRLKIEGLVHSRAFLGLEKRMSAERFRLDGLEMRLDHAANERMTEERNKLVTLSRSLKALSPDRVMERGYAVIRGDDGSVLTSAEEMVSGSRITVVMHDGSAAARIE